MSTLSAAQTINALTTLRVLGNTQQQPLSDTMTALAAKTPATYAAALQFEGQAANSGQAAAVGAATAAQNGLNQVEATLTQMRSLAVNAQSNTNSTLRASLATQYDQLRQQLDTQLSTLNYNGVALVSSTPTNAAAPSAGTGGTPLMVNATALGSASLGLSAPSGWTAADVAAGTAAIQSDIAAIDKAAARVQASAGFTSPVSSLQAAIAYGATSQLMGTSSSDLLTNAGLTQEMTNLANLQGQGAAAASSIAAFIALERGQALGG